MHKPVFFNDLVEHDMLYVAYFPQKAGNSLASDWFRTAPSCLVEQIPDAAPLAEVVRLFDCREAGQPVWLRADAMAQEALLYHRVST